MRLFCLLLMFTIYFPLAPWNTCFNSAEALQFYNYMMSDERQARDDLTCDPLLVGVATVRATIAASGEKLSHCDAQGICANAYVRFAGCDLPTSYTANGNQVESLVAGTRDMASAYRALADSPSHYRHLMGESDLFEEQDRIGIAVVTIPDSRYETYTSIIIAKCRGN